MDVVREGSGVWRFYVVGHCRGDSFCLLDYMASRDVSVSNMIISLRPKRITALYSGWGAQFHSEIEVVNMEEIVYGNQKTH